MNLDWGRGGVGISSFSLTSTNLTFLNYKYRQQSTAVLALSVLLTLFEIIDFYTVLSSMPVS